MKAQSDEEVDERRNPIKRAQKQKQFRTVGPCKDIIVNPTQIYETACKLDKSFKTVKNAHPKNKQFHIMDFSLNARGPQEDQIYSTQPFFKNNIRRGNTVVYDTATKEAIWARKGLIKFFDISRRSIKSIIQSDVKSLHSKDKNNHYAIFSEIENVLSCNEELEEKDKAKVHIYRLNKANGENAQISYLPQFDEWVVSSKNVSVLLHDKMDLKLYTGERYQFAILMAQAWFNIIEKKNKNQIELLKKDLTGKTMIGEYCGNPEFQHLVKYQEITIYFYAIVENISSESCILPPEAFKIFQQHKIPIVKNYQKSFYGKYANFVELGQTLEKLFKEVSQASIFDEEEGSVIYFIIEKPKIYCEYISDRYLQNTVPLPDKWESQEIWFKVSSLGKLKTLEYRLLRKLRQKLKYYTRTKKSEDDKEKNINQAKKLEEKYGSFEKEVKDLVKNDTLSKPIQYYFCIAIIAFEYVFKQRKNKRNLDTLSNHYLDFLSVIFWCVENKKEVTPNLMNDETLHLELRKTTWENYSVEIVQNYETMLQNFAPKYAKIKKAMKEEDVEEEAPEGDDD